MPKVLQSTNVRYTCPMHPEIVREEPDSCPICGMALEPLTVIEDEEQNPELTDMTRRFWISAVLTLPVVWIAMSGVFFETDPLESLASRATLSWLELLLATPVVLWGGWPFFVRAWQSVANRSLNMFTLIGLGVAVAWAYSVVAKLFPDVFPDSFRGEGGEVDVLLRGRRRDHDARPPGP